jgi:hypothetical protein
LSILDAADAQVINGVFQIDSDAALRTNGEGSRLGSPRSDFFLEQERSRLGLRLTPVAQIKVQQGKVQQGKVEVLELGGLKPRVQIGRRTHNLVAKVFYGALHHGGHNDIVLDDKDSSA